MTASDYSKKAESLFIYCIIFTTCCQPPPAPAGVPPVSRSRGQVLQCFTFAPACYSSIVKGKRNYPQPEYTKTPRNILHELQRRRAGSVDAAPKIAGAGLTKRCFRSRVLYLGSKGRMKLFSANFYEKSQKYFTRTGGSVDAAPIIAGAGLTKHCFRSRVLYLDGMGKQIISKASSISKFQKYFTRTGVPPVSCSRCKL